MIFKQAEILVHPSRMPSNDGSVKCLFKYLISCCICLVFFVPIFDGDGASFIGISILRCASSNFSFLTFPVF